MRFCPSSPREGRSRRSGSIGKKTGVGLKEAKDAVEALERGEDIPARELDDDLMQQVSSLLGRGEKIEAIKLYRERTGVGLKEAKEAVETFGAQHGIVVKGAGCRGSPAGCHWNRILVRLQRIVSRVGTA
jgi:ribosomal protein L7/L12